MKVTEVWYDGKCKLCGSNVYETILDETDTAEEAKFADYKNACSNEKCTENKWHYVSDQDFLNYYDHTWY